MDQKHPATQVADPKSARHEFVPMARPVLGARELEYVEQAIRSSWISSQGEFVTRFENEFSRYCGAAEGIAVSNGTTALHLAMRVLGVGPGDEVIVPAITHIAVPNAVALAGGTPVVVDCEPDTWNLDPAQLERKVTQRTRAIVVVHLYGHPADMTPILEIGRRQRVPVVEDAAEAHGAEFRGQRAGSLGDLACFSFYANKIITTGEGGMIVTSRPELAARARKLRDQAYEPEQRFLHREMGFNYRFTNVQGAIGCAQMERIDEFVATRRRHAALYNRLLAGCAGLRLPVERKDVKNVYWMYSVVLEHGNRVQVMERLRSENIETRPFFVPLHQQPLYAAACRGERFPVAEEVAAGGLNLPSGNELTEATVERLATALRAALG